MTAQNLIDIMQSLAIILAGIAIIRLQRET